MKWLRHIWKERQDILEGLKQFLKKDNVKTAVSILITAAAVLSALVYVISAGYAM